MRATLFQIVGGRCSPNAFLFARNSQEARETYNNWLEKTQGRRDEGVGAYPVDENSLIVANGGTITYQI